MGRDSRPRSRVHDSRRSPQHRRRALSRERRRSPSPARRRDSSRCSPRHQFPSPVRRERRPSRSRNDRRRSRSRSPRRRQDVHEKRKRVSLSASHSPLPDPPRSRPSKVRQESMHAEQLDEVPINGDGGDEEARLEIVEGVPRVNGDPTWQAQIYVPRQGVSFRPSQKPVTLCIRGPSRPCKEDVEDDGRKLEAAFKEGGISRVRKVRSILNNDAGRGGWGM
mmetsp:Transcript_73077/g.144916  ORF Transcript_73077/g.144916 Transcript_73077/m.144916 type:complete len:222 (+) Transcript_73077:58-723(+)